MITIRCYYHLCRCHYGPCPPCGMPCGTELPCGHTCGSSTCHDARPPSVPNFAQPLPPQLPALREGWVLREGWAAQQRSNGGGAPPVLLPPSHAASGAAGGTAAVSGADLHGSLGASRPAAAEVLRSFKSIPSPRPIVDVWQCMHILFIPVVTHPLSVHLKP